MVRPDWRRRNMAQEKSRPCRSPVYLSGTGRTCTEDICRTKAFGGLLSAKISLLGVATVGKGSLKAIPGSDLALCRSLFGSRLALETGETTLESEAESELDEEDQVVAEERQLRVMDGLSGALASSRWWMNVQRSLYLQ